MKKTPGLHECLICSKTFARRDALRRHKVVHTGNKSVSCPKCDATFRRADNMKRHLRTQHRGPSNPPAASTNQPTASTTPPQDQPGCSHGPTPSAPVNPTAASTNPPTSFSIPSQDQQPGCSHWSSPVPSAGPTVSTSPTLPTPAAPPTQPASGPPNDPRKCPECRKTFTRVDSLNRHFTKFHSRRRESSASPQPGDELFQEDPFLFTEDDDDEQSRVIRDNWDSIRTHQLTEQPVEDVFNIRIARSKKNYKNTVKSILSKLTNGERINISFGAVVRHVETGELRYFDPDTARYFPDSVNFNSQQVAEQFIEQFQNSDITEFVRQHLPNWFVVSVTNVRLFIRQPADPLEEDPEDFPEALRNDENEHSRVYRENWAAIRTHHLVGRVVQDIYNVRMDLPLCSLARIMNSVFKKLTCRGKINISFGFILRHAETGELRYFHPSYNNAKLFSTAITIGSRDDMDNLILRLEQMDILEHLRQQRPDTKWTVVSLTNVAIYVNKMEQFYIGTPSRDLPDFIKNNRGVDSLTHNAHSGQRYADNLCFFRCLALHRGATMEALERPTRHLVETFQRATGRQVSKGVTMEDVTTAEQEFQVNIQVYSLTQHDGGGDGLPQTKVQLIRRSARRHPSTLYLNLFEDHFSYIADLKKYSQHYECTKCRTVFDRSFNLQRHEPICNVNVKHKFPGGVYSLPQTIFDKLEDVGINVDDDLKYFPYRATYDYECYFDEVADRNAGQGGKLKWCNRHELLSVSVASNVPNFESLRCFVSEGDPGDLVEKNGTLSAPDKRGRISQHG
ncbi:uncharacterized protein LOC119726482 [Patiria miniata]|uniref:C2H2-type domain-containing protein n=1 Tax=Patiria miniata TaxID=46514 RepID=A0A913ZQR2_PATMI|nr:uncharacterized protein LOC119726482 [Patiria miniata]